VPLPLHSDFLQSLVVVSVHAVPAATSLFRQVPDPLQVSAPEHSLVPLPLHEVPVASGAVQSCADSLHESLQFGPTLLPGHGSPLWLAHEPDALHVSVPSQNTPSSQLVPLDWLVKFWSHMPLPLHSAFLQSVVVVSVHTVPAATSLF
jgi:hypothetical protein